MPSEKSESPEPSTGLFDLPKLSKHNIPWSFLLLGITISGSAWYAAQRYASSGEPVELDLHAFRVQLVLLWGLLGGLLMSVVLFVLIWVLKSRYIQALELGCVLKNREIEAQELAEKLRQENILLKQSREDHLSSEAKYKDVLDRSLHGIFRADAEGRFLEVNPAMAQVMGYDSSEDMLASQTDLGGDMYVDPSTRNELIRALLEEGCVEKFEAQVRRKDGHLIWLSIYIRAVRDVKQTVLHYKGVVSDITAHRNLESQLSHAQKMDAIGRLAGGVAHDFNNLLMVILNRAQMLESQVTANSVQSRNARAIVETGERAAKLTRQLLIFSRKQAFQTSCVDLNTTINEVSRLLIRLIGEDIKLKLKLSASSCLVKADPTQLEQAVMNLAVNARDAMPDGGELRIETTVVEMDSALASRLSIGLEAKNYVVMTVTDTGCGMDQSIKEHLFEPFFTTKGPNKGTGLGLSVVYGMTRQCGGQVTVDSIPGQGSTFKIYLPQIARDSKIIEKKPSRRSLGHGTPVLPCNKGVVLLVEDDIVVRDVVREMLRGLQYEVLVPATTQDAIEVFEKEKNRIELLLTDVIMPEMSGPQLARRLAQIKPELSVVFMSGYTDGSLASHGVHMEDVNFLQKPFPIEELREKLQNAGKMTSSHAAT